MIFGKALDPYEMAETFKSSREQSVAAKKTYAEKLENATGIDIYKYVFLINNSALEGYVLETRMQAQQSFSLSKLVSVAGFVIVAVAIGLSLGLTIAGKENLNSAYLTGIAGVLTEFIAGVFFVLYSKTLTQINLFHDKLTDMQKTALTHISDAGEKETHTPAKRPADASLPLEEATEESR